MTTQILDFGPSSESARASTRKRVSPTLADSPAGVVSPIVTTQYTILVDSQETIPYAFTGLQTDAGKPLAVITQIERLGIGWGDYSIRGMEPKVIRIPPPGEIGALRPIISLERKSMDDAHGTFLGFRDGRRDRFERELSLLNGITFAAVIVECTEPELYINAPEWGQKTAAENAKTLGRTIDSWRIQFNRVQWVFCEDRRMAEVKAFRLLDKFWRENHAK